MHGQHMLAVAHHHLVLSMYRAFHQRLDYQGQAKADIALSRAIYKQLLEDSRLSSLQTSQNIQC